MKYKKYNKSNKKYNCINNMIGSGKNKTYKKIKINNILNEYYDWEGENIWYKLQKKKCDINKIFNRITNKHNKRGQKVEMIKTDTGIIVIVLKHIVIRIYKKEKYEKIKDILDLIHPNIENTIDKIQFENLFFVISKKIIPILTDFNINPLLDKKKIIKDKLIEDIDSALNEIDENGYIQGDARLDNVGVEINDNEYIYVIFDFGATTKKSETSRNTEGDKRDFRNSVKKILN